MMTRTMTKTRTMIMITKNLVHQGDAYDSHDDAVANAAAVASASAPAHVDVDSKEETI